MRVYPSLIVNVIKLYYVSTLSSIVTVRAPHRVDIFYAYLQMRVKILFFVGNLAAVETMRKIGSNLNSLMAHVYRQKENIKGISGV